MRNNNRGLEHAICSALWWNNTGTRFRGRKALFTKSCSWRDGWSGAGRLLHDDWQGRGQAPPLESELDEFHGDGELQSVHLAIVIRVSEVPTRSGGGEKWERAFLYKTSAKIRTHTGCPNSTIHTLPPLDCTLITGGWDEPWRKLVLNRKHKAASTKYDLFLAVLAGWGITNQISARTEGGRPDWRKNFRACSP